jgi:hypothetical protein
MLKRVTVQLPEEWVDVLRAEGQKAEANLSEIFRRIIHRSLSSRGYSVPRPTIVPGRYDRFEKGLLSDQKRCEHVRRLKNRERVRRQIERQRAERERQAFMPAYQFDGAGGVWSVDSDDEVAAITYRGDLVIMDRRHSKDAIIRDLQQSLRLFPERPWRFYHYLLAGVPNPSDED